MRHTIPSATTHTPLNGKIAYCSFERKPMTARTAFRFAAVLSLSALAGSSQGAPATPPAEACSGIHHEIVTVKAERNDWTSAELRIRPNDVILVSVGGRLTVIGDSTRTVSAKGMPNGTGSLEMRVGTGTIVPVGTHWFGSFPDYGTLKFRIAAAHRNELAGNYKVNLMVIESEALPETITLDGE